MGFAQFIVPITQKVVLRVAATQAEVLKEISDHFSSEKRAQSAISPDRHGSNGGFRIDGKIFSSQENYSGVTRFQYARHASGLLKPFQPEVLGEVRTVPGGETEIELKYGFSRFSEQLIILLVAMILGVAFGTFGALRVVPESQAMYYTMIHGITIPAIVTAAAIAITSWLVSQDAPALVDSFTSGFRTLAVKNTQEHDFSVGSFLTQAILNSVLFGVFVLGGAGLWHSYAINCWLTGRYAECEKLCRPVLNLRLFLLGDHNPAVTFSKYNLAESLRAQGKYAEAVTLYEQSLAEFKAQLGVYNGTVGDALFNLGRANEGMGRFKYAETYYQQAIAVYSALPGFGKGTSIWIARVRDRLAMALMKQGDLAGAFDEELKALAIDQRYGKSGGRAVGEDYNNIGVISFKEGQFDDAQMYFTKSLSAKSSDKSETPYSVGVTELNLARVLDMEGRTSDASLKRLKTFGVWSKYLNRPVNDGASAYKLILEKNGPDYEKETFDTRSEQMIDGPGRI